MSSPSACIVSSSLNWFPSSPRSNSKVQPGYLNSGSPPGASITPSSEANSVTTIRAAIVGLLCRDLVPADRVSAKRALYQTSRGQDRDRRAKSSHDPVDLRRAGRSAAPANELDEPVEDPAAVGAEPVVPVFAGDPRAQATDLVRRFLGERALDVHVVRVDRRGGRDLVVGQHV